MPHSADPLQLDHLAVVAADLETGVAAVAAAIGAAPGPGGQHAHYGTHNRLLSLGPELYLEVIAPDPRAPAPPHPRWFGLDHPPQAPRLANWIVAADDLAALPCGPAVSLRRDALAWDITVPPDGSLPAGGGLPTLIRWGAGGSPAPRLPDIGLRLECLVITHPEAARLQDMVTPLMPAARIEWRTGPAPGLQARIATPGGLRWL